MNYYSEEEVIKMLMKGEDYTEVAAKAIVFTMTPDLPTQSDRERIRMELWKDLYLMYMKEVPYTVVLDYYNNALAAFDKQFPNS